MLNRLVITNLAILENVDVSFKEGFTVLIGGTGAGKSLVIDSLSLLLGARASSELIRTGEDKATIRGYFTVDSPRLRALLSKLEIPCLEDELIVERVISHGKNSIKANGVSLTLADLAGLAKHLADIHNQLDFVKILNPENYLGIIDGFAYEQIAPHKADYAALLSSYRDEKAKLESLLAQKAAIEASKDFYLFQLKELDEANIQENEEAEINAEIALLSNYDHIYSLFQNAESIIRGDFLDQLYELDKVLAKLSSYQPKYAEIHEKVDDRYYELEDLFGTLKKEFKNLDYDPERLDVLQQRSADLASLKRKYRKTLPELIAYHQQLKSMLGEGSDIEEKIASATQTVESLRHECFVKASELTVYRKQTAKTIERDVKRNLDDLLLHCDFRIDFASYEESNADSLFTPEGIDTVDFLIETNVGEGLKSLSKIVSGGEASRIMLALKVLFIKANKISTVIFDEIDTGLSGEAASKVAAKIKEVSLQSQVIAITHMPQVAARSDHGILIAKQVSAGRTSTHIKELSLEEKIHEVAALISGGKVTQKQLAYAREIVLNPED